MSWNLFKSRVSDCLGIDIGTSALRVVELRKENDRIKLVNYALAAPQLLETEKTFRTSDLQIKELANLISRTLAEAKVKSKKAVFSLPTFSSFSVLVTLPPMPQEEFGVAIPFEVKKYIPVPMEEIVLDWSVIGKIATIIPPSSAKTGAATKLESTQVLVVAVPKEVVNKYVQVAKLAGLDLLTLEHESFSLARSLVGNDLGLYLIIDIGLRGSSLIVVDNGFVMLSHTLEKGDQQAICAEIRKVVGLYKMRYNKNIKNCILVGGMDRTSLTSYVAVCLTEMETAIGNPFARVEYLPKLEPMLKEIGSSLAVSVGLAMRELQNIK